ncbi:hypothetical protein PGT21_008167 [Puccinia graminis f. sp. tritici]|uniref:Uncharacterized protein n=1 Tax=Puccinia graminis f. sp. tritici TaxID=56615 RepID=A0A5B0P6J1_PUCGR|nr:hypothetical protein PGT21_008167 [Puccinia graminis f. sp. tritici]
MLGQTEVFQAPKLWCYGAVQQFKLLIFATQLWFDPPCCDQAEIGILADHHPYHHHHHRYTTILPIILAPIPTKTSIQEGIQLNLRDPNGTSRTPGLGQPMHLNSDCRLHKS